MLIYLRYFVRALSWVLLVCTIAMAKPAYAHVEVGWLLADRPSSSAPYNPAARYNFPGGTLVTITRLSTGFYQVEFSGLQNNYSSNVQLTAYGSNGYCVSAGWGTAPGGKAIRAMVACFGAQGANADTQFTLLYQAHDVKIGSASRGFAYVLAGSPTVASYTPNAATSYNSRGGTNTVVRNSVGNYTVTFPGFLKNGGDVQVTAYSGFDVSNNPARCKTSGWTNDGSRTNVNVRCFGSGGAAADQAFSLAYSLLEPFAPGDIYTPQAMYEWANEPKQTSDYVPAPVYQYNSFATGHITSQRTGVGAYLAELSPLSYYSATALATARGVDNAYCNLAYLDPTLSKPIQIACYRQGGKPIDSEFDMVFQTFSENH